MRHALAACTSCATAAAAVLALAAGAAAADMDMLGTWSGDYVAVSPTTDMGPGPRFDTAQWEIEIKDQKERVFWGESRWRRLASDDWSTYELTGNLRADGSGILSMAETSSDPTVSVNSLIDGRVDGDRIYVDFMSLRDGTTYSAVLERKTGGAD